MIFLPIFSSLIKCGLDKCPKLLKFHFLLSFLTYHHVLEALLWIYCLYILSFNNMGMIMLNLNKWKEHNCPMGHRVMDKI